MSKTLIKIQFSYFFLFLFVIGTIAQTALKPFPQHNIYTAGTIMALYYSQSKLDIELNAFCEKWKPVCLID